MEPKTQNSEPGTRNPEAAPPPGNEVVITVENLQKVFRDFWHRPRVKAVNGINFEVRRGEVFGLLGPNGSGKSTTLKMLLGLLHPSQGRIQVLGRPPRDVKAKARMGYLPEESYLYGYLSARETLDFYGRLFDLSRAERRNRTDQLLEMVGLQHMRNRPVREFSKGMARRIGLAQALVNDPDLILLDEPTSGLDPLGTRQVKDLIVTLAKRGKTVILSSHLLADVEDVCDRIAILYGGKIHAHGAIRDLLQVQERYQIALPELDPAALEKVLATLRQALGEDPQLEHPSRNLEQFFLEVIARARADRIDREQAGAGEGRQLAAYLEDEVRSPADALAALTPSATTPEAPPPDARPEPVPEHNKEEVNQRLNHLLNPTEKDADPDA